MTQEERYMKLVVAYNKNLEANKKKKVGKQDGWTPTVDFDSLTKGE